MNELVCMATLHIYTIPADILDMGEHLELRQDILPRL